LIIHAFLRPVMTIFGLVASMLLFNISAYLVTEFYRAIASNVGTFSGAMYVVAKICFGWMYVSILYTCLNASLKAMDTLAKHATTWMGGRAHEENMGDGQSAVQMAKEGAQMFSQGLSGMASSSLNAGLTMAQPSGAGSKGGSIDKSKAHDKTAPQLPSSGSPDGAKPQQHKQQPATARQQLGSLQAPSTSMASMAREANNEFSSNGGIMTSSNESGHAQSASAQQQNSVNNSQVEKLGADMSQTQGRVSALEERAASNPPNSNPGAQGNRQNIPDPPGTRNGFEAPFSPPPRTA
jgi:uncharacterized phage infection (PIP) family protein YhgE